MSGLPAAEIDKGTFGNSPSELKLRSAAKMLRFLQKTMIPSLDEGEAALKELQATIKVYGALTDEDVAKLGMSAATYGKFVAFLEKLLEFADKSTTTADSYRTALYAARQINSQL